MSEEEILINIKEMINICDSLPSEECTAHIISHDHFNAVKGLLDLYNKQKEEIEQKDIMNEAFKNALGNIIKGKKWCKEIKGGKTIHINLVGKLNNDYISKDKVLKAMGYEENDEEYERIKQDDEKLLSILDTMYSEVCRLEDIEDKKVEVAINFIEEKKDKYWQKKINDKIKELEKEKEKEKYKGDKGLIYSQVGFIQSGINVLNKLLEEK